MRVVVWFSCGAASAVAAKLALDTYPHEQVHVVYCDTMSTEHHDNQRFFDDIEKWIGKKIERISSKKYTSVDDVFEKTRYLSGIAGARCTVEMKKVPRFEYQLPDDIHIFGLTADEKKRIKRFEENNIGLCMDWILVEKGMTKARCLQYLQDAGISLPVMYSLGYKNNNCLGCVKATSSKYWQMVRSDFPEVFERRVRQSRELGVRLVYYKGKRIFLDELPVGSTDQMELENISCGPDCGPSPSWGELEKA